MVTTPDRLQAMVLILTEFADRPEYRKFAEGVAELGKGTVEIKCELLYGVYDMMASIYSDNPHDAERTVLDIRKLPYVRSVMTNIPMKEDGCYFCNDW